MMAKDFGVSKEFIDKELHRLIATGQLHCRIDAVRGIIIMNHPDTKNHLYHSVIKFVMLSLSLYILDEFQFWKLFLKYKFFLSRDGDILLNRIQKLARVINA